MNKIAYLLFITSLSTIGCRQSDYTKARKFTCLNSVKCGINFINQLSYDESFNVYLYKSFYNGAGVGMGDLNNDGLVDLFFCGNQLGNKAYLNRGNFQFDDITDSAGLGKNKSWATGVSIVDVNADGWLDIYVCKSGKPDGQNRHNELFINKGLNNEGIPFFVESAKEYGIADIGFSVHAVFFDYDRDSDLDFYLLNNSITPSEIIIDAKQGLRDKRDEAGNKLYRNDGKHFTDVTMQAGIYSSAIGFGLGVSVGDLNKDGWLDMYVANDFFEKDYLYLNNQDGTFSEVLEQAVTEIGLGSMGVDIADVNNDGFPEIFVTEMLPENQSRLKTKVLFDNWDSYTLKLRNGYFRQFPRNMLQLNNGTTEGANKISFSEISRHAGVHATDWSWGVLMADLDNDGFKEIFVTNGIVKDLLDQDYIDFYTDPERIRSIYQKKGAVIKELVDSIPSEPINNYVFKHTNDLQFKNVATEWGMDTPAFSTGSAFGDLDNDGDLDVVVNNINSLPFIYRNESSKDSTTHFINITLHGVGSNSNAVGAQVTLTANRKIFYQELLPMRGTMSTSDNRLHFGLGDCKKIDIAEIRWPDRTKTIRKDVSVDQFITINQKEEKQSKDVSSLKENELAHPWLSDVSKNINLPFKHVENNFVDFNHDRLLPHMISNTGPALAEGDVNKDGLTDFYIGGAKGKAGKLFIQSMSDHFIATNQKVFDLDSASEDSDAVFFDADGDSDLDLIVGSGGYEFSASSFALADRLYLNDGKGNFKKSPQVIPSNKLENTSVITACDFDLDGDEDLFIGTRGKPLRYGVNSDSYLLENDGKGNFIDVTLEKAPTLKDLGMVTDALWMDYDRDGDSDLFLVGDWMPLKLFKNNKGKFMDESSSHGLNKSNGFWNVIEKADLDEDGDLDLIAGNLGTNSIFKASVEKPVRMHVGDFDQNGEIEQIITVYNGEKAYPFVTKKEIVSQLPYLKKKYLKYKDFAQQQIEDVFSNRELKYSTQKEVFTTSTTVFWNEGEKFESQPLPLEAQLSPVYSILVEDLNDDGSKEIILGGNQYRAKPQVGIYAASHGTILQLSGNRQFKKVDSSQSGFFVEGEIRNMIKVQSQKKTYLLVARNDDTPRFFLLQDAKKIK
jgi:enediyne biosynthesis protein E4